MINITNINKFSDHRGSLFPLNFKDIPFEVKRLFLIKDVPKNCIRGNHAHYVTEQYLICTKGEIEVSLHDGKSEEICKLIPMQCVHVKNLIWDYQKFNTGDDELLVLASTEYNEKDYIHDFEQFLNLVS
jgi:UDP-2-acetamido-3-amino-2,3-dideoxy-glucuronate N-acetyltransferase